MPSDSTPSPLSATSGAARRRRRVERGLLRYTGAELEATFRNKQRRNEERLARVRAIKLERGCADCGYREHPAALDFDHLPGSGKVVAISRLFDRASIERVLAEIAKCEVVCANCHRIRTVERARALRV